MPVWFVGFSLFPVFLSQHCFSGDRSSKFINLITKPIGISCGFIYPIKAFKHFLDPIQKNIYIESEWPH